MSRRLLSAVLLALVAIVGVFSSTVQAGPIKAGAAAVDVSPLKLPVIVNGGFLEARTSTVHDRLFARAIVVDDGATRIAIVVVDSCMMPRELIDRAKEAASAKTGIRVDRMLVSATHTHTAPACMGALGTPVDEAYAAFLPSRIAEAIIAASERLEPARVGWIAVQDFEHTHNRSWIYRSDAMLTDPFGEKSVRANMHPGYQNPNTIGPSGPVDPELSILSFRTRDYKPLALLANYSMHYFGTSPVSADYFGMFADGVSDFLLDGKKGVPFVAVMSQGTSGDQHWMDYSKSKREISMSKYADQLARIAGDNCVKLPFEANPRKIPYENDLTIAMAETKIQLKRRTANPQRIAWAKDVIAKMSGEIPKTQQEVYAKEVMYLENEPVRELKLQAIRLGNLAIVAIPNEVYAITGLKIKAMSPLPATFTMELANGAEGYIPPPEQHRLGGYTTWPARTAGLEVGAEPAILEATLKLLETVAGKPRKAMPAVQTPYSSAILASKPRAFWRLGDIAGDRAADATGNVAPALYQGMYAFYLDGPETGPEREAPPSNRAVQFVSGGLKAAPLRLGNDSAISFWFWNGFPDGIRERNGQLLSVSDSKGKTVVSIALRNPAKNVARIALSPGGEIGKSRVTPKAWHHLALMRSGEQVAVYLDGEKELVGTVASANADGDVVLSFAGGGSDDPPFEGKLAEIAVHDRLLDAGEIGRLAHTSPRGQ